MRIAIITTDNRDYRGERESPCPCFGSAPAALLEGFSHCGEVEVHVISCSHQPIPAPPKLADNVFFHSVVVPRIGWMRTLYLGCIVAVRERLQQIRPDIVHGQGTERDCAMAAVFSGYPNVLTIHGNMVEVAKALNARFLSFHWLAARLETFALRRTSGVLCNSQHTQSLVSPRAPRTWLVPNPLQKGFLNNPPPGRVGGFPVLLNIGTINENKQQNQLLELAAELHHSGLRFRLDFAGEADGSEYSRIFLKRVRDAEAAGYAKYLGFLQTPTLIDALDGAHALVHTPKSEAFGLVIAEALARNARVFAFASGGVRDIAAGSPGALLVAPEDWKGLAACLRDWLRSGTSAPESAALMRQNYEPEVITRRHIQIYQNVLTT
jgi:glycosyltransferase involved in cell wall biosynthesis